MQRPFKTFYYTTPSLGWDTRGASTTVNKAIRAAVYRMLEEKFTLIHICFNEEIICQIRRSGKKLMIELPRTSSFSLGRAPDARALPAHRTLR